MTTYTEADLTRVENVKPDHCGEHDEGWFIGLRPDGRWQVWSDANTPYFGDDHSVADEVEARQFWDDAAEADESVNTPEGQ